MEKLPGGDCWCLTEGCLDRIRLWLALPIKVKMSCQHLAFSLYQTDATCTPYMLYLAETR